MWGITKKQQALTLESPASTKMNVQTALQLVLNAQNSFFGVKYGSGLLPTNWTKSSVNENIFDTAARTKEGV
jgi:hypothetical protein